ncbi:hypothetical protein DB313_06165 (plasmid) [Borrelia turcica IST7]|uniref:Uncharacterized protein n=1 Tax=Borrelia turcica IST7 TaxID=1104446 RepID=A0A386PP98_9SPIR|nr:hypothetical protein [Borrelia turcica]AYE37012.1 hypothetical protein DB313_05790 [Borrelia turcica IST7]AYE37083.1 hypothetical protein DB313_06165 [Borrelia turcica IST7]
MFNFLHLFTKKRKNITKKHSTDIISVNSSEFILLATALIQSGNIKHNLLGIIMSTGIPLAHLNDKIILKQKSNNTIIYKITNSKEFIRHTLIDPKLVVHSIRALYLKNPYPHYNAWELNRILKKVLRSNITTKTLEKIYSLILSQSTSLAQKNASVNNIQLVRKPVIESFAKIILHINSFTPLRINKANLAFYKASNSLVKHTIALLIEDFFSANNLATHKNTLHNLNAFLKVKLKEKGINFKSTYKHRKELLSSILSTQKSFF